MKTGSFGMCAAVVAAAALWAGAAEAQHLSPIEQLGKHLFFDENLSMPPGQSCAACHGPEAGWTGPVSEINAGGAVYPGAVHRRFGNRKPPTVAYAGPSPVFHFDEAAGHFVGGMLWDGRATGWTLGDPLAEQALGPFLHPLEQKIPHAKQVVRKVARSSYARLFEEVWGPGSLDTRKNVRLTYERIGRSIAAYERSREVSAYSSKFDAWLAGKAELTGQELEGLRLFEGKAKCSQCHVSTPGPNGEPPLFTNFGFENIGTPRNPLNPFYSAPRSVNPDGPHWVDPGLAGFLATVPELADPHYNIEETRGYHKVPTLRNVDKRPHPEFVKAYAHNGYFKSLKEIVHFYNTRDVLPKCEGLANPQPGINCWPEAEVPETVDTERVGNLGLTEAEEEAIVAFLKTLSDGWTPEGE